MAFLVTESLLILLRNSKLQASTSVHGLNDQDSPPSLLAFIPRKPLDLISPEALSFFNSAVSAGTRVFQPQLQLKISLVS